jgi:FKBP-type peptidyl-prolyl cis-trans isomerase FklB
MNRFLLTFLTLLFAPIIVNAAEGLETLQQKASYSFGVDFAKRLKQQGIELDISALNRGIMDAASGNKLALEDGEMSQTKAEYTKKLRAELAKKQQELSAKNLEASKKFLAENAKKEGVVTLDSGLQYKVIKSGDGPTPKPEDTVTTHYRGTLIDGTEFDSSYKRGEPASFQVKGVIRGWTQALLKMKVGDKWELYVPPELAYGNQQRGEVIEPNSTLLFEIELLEIK